MCNLQVCIKAENNLWPLYVPAAETLLEENFQTIMPAKLKHIA